MYSQEYIDTDFRALCNEILEVSFRKMALTHCVPTSVFYDTVHELVLPPGRLLADQATKLQIEVSDEDRVGYDRFEEVRKSNYKLNALLKRILINQETENNQKEQFFAPKIFDQRLYEVMASSYGVIAPLIGDGFAANIMESRYIRALQADDRSAFAFPEFAALVCLYMTINGRAVETLNEPIKKPNQIKRLRQRKKRIGEFVFSDNYRRSLSKSVLSLLARINEQEYKQTMDMICREYWLPEEKRGLKRLDYAMERYPLNGVNIEHEGMRFRGLVYALGEDGNLLPKRVLVEDDSENNQLTDVQQNTIATCLLQKLEKCATGNARLKVMQRVFFTIMPVVELMVERIVPTNLVEINRDFETQEKLEEWANSNIVLYDYIVNSENTNSLLREYIKKQEPFNYVVSAADYLMALKIVEVVQKYVDEICMGVCTLIECFPDMNMSCGKALREYARKT